MGMPTVCPLVRREEIRRGSGAPPAPLPQAASLSAALAPAQAAQGKSGIVRRRRGNPRWTNPHLLEVGREKPTRFALLLAEMGIPEEGCQHYVRVRQWIQKNAERYYVPEYLLAACGVEINVEALNLSS